MASPSRICLLAPFSTREQARPFGRSVSGSLRNHARRMGEDLALRLGRRPRLHYSTYQRRRNVNRGDIALRLASVDLLRAAFGPHSVIEEIGWNEFPERDPAQLSEGTDLFVVGGGGYLNIAADGRLAARVVRETALLRQLTCPVVSLCPGLNCSLLHEATPEAIEDRNQALGALVDVLGLCSVRDPATQRMLEVIRPGRIECVADPALFLEPAPAPVQAAFDGWRIGLNLAFHDPIVSRDVLARLDLLSGLARFLSGIRPCRFTYFVHSDAERLFPRLLRRAGVQVQVVDGDPREMVAAYGQLDLHVCQMLHSSILAINAGVPTINLGYDVKNAGFFELIGMAELSVPAATVQVADLVDRARSLLAQRDSVSFRLRQRKAALRAGMDAFLNRVVELCRD